MDLHLAELDGFPVGPCGSCDRMVLTYPDFASDQRLHRCLHCGAAVEVAAAVPYDGIEALGYGYVDALAKQGKCASGGACPVKEDGRGGCGGGDCGAACASCV